MNLNNKKIDNYGLNFVGTGSAIPSQFVKNNDLGNRVDTNDEWIKTRTGICGRRVIGENESLSDLCTKAAHKAILNANWTPESIDMIIVATSTPDDLFGMAPKIQSNLNAKNAFAFDLTAACSGFLFAVVTASQYLINGAVKRVIVLGADQLSSWVDWDDRGSCVLFGDAAGAIAIERKDIEVDDLFAFLLKSDGSRGNCLNLSLNKKYSSLVNSFKYQKGEYLPIQMNGQEVYKFAVKEVPKILEELMQDQKINPNQLDWLLLHQANQRILDSVAERFSVPQEKVLSNLTNYGNTSAATIPLMLDEAVSDGRVKRGDLIASCGFGAGLSWGAALFRWHGAI